MDDEDNVKTVSSGVQMLNLTEEMLLRPKCARSLYEL
jgi:hypothetical protein